MRKCISLLSFLLLIFAGIGNAQQCTGSLGTPIINISFGSGSNNPAGALSTVVPGASTSYIYNSTGGNPPATVWDGEYSIVNSVPVNMYWHQNANGLDHTPGDGNNGYMAFFNARTQAGGVFYTQQVNGLCPGTAYEFAAWIANAVNSAALPSSVAPNVTFQITDPITAATLMTINTGNINPSPTSLNWQRFAAMFTANTSSVILSLTNNQPGGINNTGNDLAIDDITFSPCGPLTSASFSSISPQLTSTICQGSSFGLFGTINPPISNPEYQWQISNDNGLTWGDIPGANGLNYTHPPIPPGTYQFQLLSASAGNINSVNCRYISNPITLNAFSAPAGTLTGNGPLCIGNQGTLTFTPTSGTAPFILVYSDGTTSYTQMNVAAGNPWNLSPNPSTTTTYTLQSITDGNNCFTQTNANTTIVLKNCEPPNGECFNKVDPAIYFSVSPISKPGNCTYDLTINVTPSPGVTIVGYEWSFGDGSPNQVSYSLPVTHGFPNGGPYNVTVIIHAVKSQFKPGESPCCTATIEGQISCQCDGPMDLKTTKSSLSVKSPVTNTESKSVPVMKFKPKADQPAGSIDLFPNPANKTVNFYPKLKGSLSLIVKDATGKQVMKLNAVRGGELSTVDVSSIAKGSYLFVFTTTSGKTISKKVVVQ
jgi:Secretion system C-terminal sorting domain/PKD domain